MTKIYRVVVRGQFADLSENARGRLLAEAAEHDIFRSSFTAEGCFTYDTRLVAFNLRYEIRLADAGFDPDVAGADLGTGPDGGGGRADPESQAVELALECSTDWLTAQGIGHKRLRATATDMATMWL